MLAVWTREQEAVVHAARFQVSLETRATALPHLLLLIFL